MQTTPDELSGIRSAESYDEITQIALPQLQRMHKQYQLYQAHGPRWSVRPIGIVCGPITNGGIGKGNRKVNLKVFGAAVEHFVYERQGLFFSQMAFEDKLGEFSQQARDVGMSREDAGQQLLTEFYWPLFNSRLICEMHFLPDWESSAGATWERNRGQHLGLDIYDISEDLARTFLAAAEVA